MSFLGTRVTILDLCSVVQVCGPEWTKSSTRSQSRAKKIEEAPCKDSLGTRTREPGQVDNMCDIDFELDHRMRCDEWRLWRAVSRQHVDSEDQLPHAPHTWQ